MNWSLKAKPAESIKESAKVSIEESETTRVELDDTKVSQTAPDNPYLDFLDAVSGEQEDKSADHGSGSGLLGGLQSWLGFAGSLGGAEMTNLTSMAENANIRSVLF